jgi:beta-galactosidase/beta-glucuronidase
MLDKASIPRAEYPRPQFIRQHWVNLNGEWEFEFDDEAVGEKRGWHLPDGSPFSRVIQVPFCFQSRLSGFGETAMHDTVWYRRKLKLPPEFKNKRIILHFGAVDYQASVWVNGLLAVKHVGGHVPFAEDITDLLRDGDNVLTVRAFDPGRDLTIPRGKQYWKEQSASIYYTQTTGIWQTVWVEAVEQIHLDHVKFTPDIDSLEIGLFVKVNGFVVDRDIRLKVNIAFEGEPVSEDWFAIGGETEVRRFVLQETASRRRKQMLWSPENPKLLDIEFVLFADGIEIDRVTSYFGLRQISVENGKVCLNHVPYFMKLILDQGYFPDGLLTAPSDDELRNDVQMVKTMGFNGVRKHQKVEDPRYLYWCDRLGLLVWGEMANAYVYSDDYVYRMMDEWQGVIKRDYNHPCIVVWVPINESWGVPSIKTVKQQQDHAMAMYFLTKSLDPTRLVISNDGWEHVKSDLCTIHDYEWRRDILEQRYADIGKILDFRKKAVYADGFGYNGEPILVTEFGGISYKKGDWDGWGYSGAEDEEDLLERLSNVIEPLQQSPLVQGYCYTQLTDVEQEINGLITYHRKPKVPLESIRKIVEG